MKGRHRKSHCVTALAALLLAALGGPWVASAAGKTCELAFEVVTESAHGTLAAGARLNGSIRFSVDASWDQQGDTRSFTTKGQMVVGADGRGAVRGDIWVVHVIRTPWVADYISVDVRNVSGDLAGVNDYYDPMLVTLYAKAGTLNDNALPATAAGWDVLGHRRVFQVHTPTAQTTLAGVVGPLTGGCS